VAIFYAKRFRLQPRCTSCNADANLRAVQID
jgi:hypothetical protein